jgi:hypothetical protein
MIDTKLNNTYNNNKNNIQSNYVVAEDGNLVYSPNKNQNSRSKIFS